MILRPRVVLEAISQSGSQDLLAQEARSFWESQQDAESYWETRSNTADCRVPGTSISTVKMQDARRQNNVTKLIEMFEKNIGIRTIPYKHDSKAGDQQVQRGISTITRRHEPHRDLRIFARTLQNFNVLIAILSRKSGLFIAVSGEI